VICLVINLGSQRVDVRSVSLFARELQLHKIRRPIVAQGTVDLPSTAVVGASVLYLGKVQEVVEPILEVVPGLLASNFRMECFETLLKFRPIGLASLNLLATLASSGLRLLALALRSDFLVLRPQVLLQLGDGNGRLR